MGTQRADAHNSVAQIASPLTAYPATSTALTGAIHDVGFHQDLLAIAGNFAGKSRFDVLEWLDDKASMRTVLGEQECHAYVEVCLTKKKVKQRDVNFSETNSRHRA